MTIVELTSLPCMLCSQKYVSILSHVLLIHIISTSHAIILYNTSFAGLQAQVEASSAKLQSNPVP